MAGDVTTETLQSAIAAAPSDLATWLRTQPSLEVAWTSCDRADWLLWLALRQPRDELQERRIVGATALAMRSADRFPVSERELVLATKWANRDFDDPDRTGFRATVLGLLLGGAVGIAIELWLYFRANNPIRGMQRELYSFPAFLILALAIRLIARPLLARRAISAVGRYSFARAQERILPALPTVVATANNRAELADTFRRRMAWSA